MQLIWLMAALTGILFTYGLSSSGRIFFIKLSSLFVCILCQHRWRHQRDVLGGRLIYIQCYWIENAVRCRIQFGTREHIFDFGVKCACVSMHYRVVWQHNWPLATRKRNMRTHASTHRSIGGFISKLRCVNTAHALRHLLIISFMNGISWALLRFCCRLVLVSEQLAEFVDSHRFSRFAREEIE